MNLMIAYDDDVHASELMALLVIDDDYLLGSSLVRLIGMLNCLHME